MKKLLIFWFIIFLFTSLIEAQEKRYLDGEVWNSYSLEEKYIFLNGYRVGVVRVDEMIIEMISSLEETKDKGGKDEAYLETLNFLSNIIVMDIMKIMDFDQLIAGVDNFYQDYANKHVRLHHAFLIVERRIGGISEDVLNKLILKFRRKDRG